MLCGSDTDKALKLIAKSDGDIHFRDLNITSLPPIPEGTKSLLIYNTQITEILSLPESLTELYCSGALLKCLPKVLPPNLKTLDIYSTKISELPILPKTLSVLTIVCSPVSKLPDLPQLSSLILRYTLVPSHTGFNDISFVSFKGNYLDLGLTE